MRKLKIIEHISLDGVIQHSADGGDFPYSDWTAPYRTPAGRDAIIAAHGGSFALLLGRRTYEAVVAPDLLRRSTATPPCQRWTPHFCSRGPRLRRALTDNGPRE